tara:strand:+ start:933 stop:1220 length:288 start_codon:yes stop_codon:yes gene_type:complete
MGRNKCLNRLRKSGVLTENIIDIGCGFQIFVPTADVPTYNRGMGTKSGFAQKYAGHGDCEMMRKKQLKIKIQKNVAQELTARRFYDKVIKQLESL